MIFICSFTKLLRVKLLYESITVYRNFLIDFCRSRLKIELKKDIYPVCGSSTLGFNLLILNVTATVFTSVQKLYNYTSQIKIKKLLDWF
jgi:hypothetical protein